MKSASSVLEESLPRRRMRRSVAVRIRKQHERVIPVVTHQARLVVSLGLPLVTMDAHSVAPYDHATYESSWMRDAAAVATRGRQQPFQYGSRSSQVESLARPCEPAHDTSRICTARIQVTFVVSTRRRELRDSSIMRTPARSRAELESPRARVPYIAGCDLPPETRLRTGAHVKYPTRYPPAYAHFPSNGGTPFSYVRDEVHCAMLRLITRPQIPARGGRRIPTESQSALSARSLLGMRIINVSRPHAPSIIAPWQGSGWRSDTRLPLRHDGDRRTA